MTNSCTLSSPSGPEAAESGSSRRGRPQRSSARLPPTGLAFALWGIDIGAKAEIYARIRELTRQGVDVIMASLESPERLGMSDRILVFHEGQLAGELGRADFSEETIMRLATGAEKGPAA